MDKKLNKKRKGFSLVELVVVMAITGILIMVMAPNYKGFIEQAKTMGIRSDAKTLQTMISLVEVNSKIEPDAKVSDLTGEAMGNNSSEWVNLKEFINGLSGDSLKLKEVSVKDLGIYIEKGEGPKAPENP